MITIGKELFVQTFLPCFLQTDSQYDFHIGPTGSIFCPYLTSATIWWTRLRVTQDLPIVTDRRNFSSYHFSIFVSRHAFAKKSRLHYQCHSLSIPLTTLFLLTTSDSHSNVREWENMHWPFRRPGHLDGQYLRFLPKRVFNITKLDMQIHTFWHNPRPPRLKNGLINRPCSNWKGNVCCFGFVPTHEKEIFGESKIRRDMFVHTAPQQHSKGRYLKQGN